MSKETEKPNMRTVQLLGYHTATCPHCKQMIFIPEYRVQPGTAEDNKKLEEDLRKKYGD